MRLGFLFTILGFVILGCAKRSLLHLPEGHAHNDYENERPLFDAIERGFCSIEADVWFTEGKLLVAHHQEEVAMERTLQSLYLDPLRRLLATRGHRPCNRDIGIVLLIDIKSDAVLTYRAIREILEPYKSLLTHFYRDRTDTRAVTVIISGNRPTDLIHSEDVRFAAYDGRLPDLSSKVSVHFMPLISDKWSRYFRWKGTPEEGPLSPSERNTLRWLAKQAHAQGRRIRFWDTPDTSAAWQELWEAGVDYINTDDLEHLHAFLNGKTAAKVPTRSQNTGNPLQSK